MLATTARNLCALASAPPPGELRRELGRGALAIVSLRDGEAVKAVPKALLIALSCTQDALREQSALQAACTGSDVPHVLPRLLGTAQDARCIYFRLEAVLCEGASVQLDQVLRAQTGNQLPPASAACVAGCVLGALAHLHARRVQLEDEPGLSPSERAARSSGLASPCSVNFIVTLRPSAKELLSRLPLGRAICHNY